MFGGGGGGLVWERRPLGVVQGREVLNISILLLYVHIGFLKDSFILCIIMVVLLRLAAGI